MNAYMCVCVYVCMYVCVCVCVCTSMVIDTSDTFEPIRAAHCKFVERILLDCRTHTSYTPLTRLLHARTRLLHVVKRILPDCLT
jgi:hypothetical protein